MYCKTVCLFLFLLEISYDSRLRQSREYFHRTTFIFKPSCLFTSYVINIRANISSSGAFTFNCLIIKLFSL